MLFDDIINEKIIINEEGFFTLSKPVNIINIVVFIILIYYIYKIISNSDNKIKIIFIFIIIIFFILLYIDKQLTTNKKFSNIKIELDKIKSTLNTGDIVMFKNFYVSQLYELTLFKIILPFLQETYFTHIGMIYKDTNGKIYILESDGGKLYCNLTNKYKEGVACIDIDKRINKLENYRVHIVKSNLHKYINMDKLNQSIHKYKDHLFLQDGIYCVNYIMKLLEENNLYKINDYCIVPPLPIDILKKENYKCDIIFEEPIIIKDIN
jgi:hypothetical protein